LTVTVKIMGREYSVACPQHEHEALVASAEYLNERMMANRRRGKALGSERIAVMTALNITRELLELRGEPAAAPAGDAAAAERLRQIEQAIDSALAPSE
jgi:cell division protein ZapA